MSTKIERTVLFGINYTLLPTLFFITLAPFVHIEIYESFIAFTAPDYVEQSRILATEIDSYWTHILIGAIFGICMIVQFSKSIRLNQPAIHRKSGYLMVAATVALNISGLRIAWVQPFAPTGEFALAILAFTLPGLGFYAAGIQAAIRKRFVRHRTCMIMGTAFTASIVLQRPALAVFELLTETHTSELFLLIALICSLIAVGMGWILMKSKAVLQIR